MLARSLTLLIAVASSVLAVSAGCFLRSTASAESETRGRFHKQASDEAPNLGVIVFVHGVNGNCETTWKRPDSPSWPELIAEDVAFASWDVYASGYYSPYLGGALTVQELGDRLNSELEQRDILTRQGHGRYERIVFVCHSMGNLVVRAAMTGSRRYDDVEVPLIVSLAAPSAGSDIARIMELLSKNPQYRDLVPIDENSFLQALNRHFLDAFPETEIACAYEKLDHPKLGKLIVEMSSATYLCTVSPSMAFACDHETLVKPSGRDDEVYKWAANEIRRSGGGLDVGTFDRLLQEGNIEPTQVLDAWPEAGDTSMRLSFPTGSQVLRIRRMNLPDNTTVTLTASEAQRTLIVDELRVGRNCTLDLSAPETPSAPAGAGDKASRGLPSWGKPGKDGGSGKEGARGVNGSPLTLVVGQVRGPEALWIRTDGGPGGDGGAGGSGGEGGGSSTGPGDEPKTDGGRGGRGGDGGPGGDGGNTSEAHVLEFVQGGFRSLPVSVATNARWPSERTDLSFAASDTIVIYGQPGPGGRGGAGGPGGRGGGKDRHHMLLGSVSKGPNGPDGRSAARGSPGLVIGIE